ncbi:MAG: hypothetical protein KF760_25585 [Candidatus Eremiobacteraeota bacterium]|nr:hypothetical protein [Candidatus Eremiobacteraeota bacterium]MCW5866850.1 hypothetical protein [Candidatus Eremiobacteraeota bacterium]
METSPLNRLPQVTGPLHRPPAPKADPPPAAPADKVQLQGNETPKQLFAKLKELGRDPGRDAAARMTGSLKSKYESLIRFQGEEELVLSLRDPKELAEYVALVGGGQASADVQQNYAGVQARQDQGDRFFLKRAKQYLKTDAAGAAVVLSRGGEVVRLAVDGQVDRWKELPAEVPAPTPARAELGKLLDAAEALKCTFEVEPEKTETSIKGKLLAMLKGKGDEVEVRAGLVDALEKGKRVLITLPDDDRKIPLPPGVDKAQLEKFVGYVSKPDEDQKNFLKAFEDLKKKEAVIMARSDTGELKGMLMTASDRSAYLNLLAGQEVVVLTRDGTPQRLTEVAQMAELSANGSLKGQAAPKFDGSGTPSDNLFMVYHVSPFDPINKGIYDDLVRRMTEVGSSKEVDIVAMHSDLPDKRNLRVDRIQSGSLENLKKLDPETVMSDPKTFENFLFETLMANQSDAKVRLFVGGHGGAEKGLLPDGKHNNAAANHAMSVDDFAGAIPKALDRVEKETGKRPFIENLMLCSCLMGNTSLIDALAKTGDVGVLCASPEIMQGASPNSVIEFLHDPKTSQASGEEFAKYLVDTLSEAPSAPGGNKESHHADTYGAYRLDKQLAENTKKSLDNFFKLALQHPDQAGAIKRAIADCPTYGMNPFINLLFDVDNRDLIQVAERIIADARVTNKELKEAAQKVVDDAAAQVIEQKVSKNYAGRKGPTIYLPIDRFDFDEKMSKTGFLQSTDYSKFMEMIFDAPLHRGVKETFLTEANRYLEAGKEAAAAAAADEKEDDKKAGEPEETKKESKTWAGPGKGVIQQVHDLEQYHGDNALKKIGRGVRAIATAAIGIAGGLALAAVGAVPGAVMGAVLGARAGWTGHSALSEQYGAGDTAPAGGNTLKSAVKLAGQAALFPMEAAGLRVNDKVGFKAGTLAGRLVGSVAGLAGGALGGALGGGAVGFVPGFVVARGLGRAATFWVPGGMPEKIHNQGLDSDLTKS